MKRELPAGAEKRCFVGSSFCFSDFEKLLLTTNTPIGIQGGNSVKKLEEFLEWGGTKKDITLASLYPVSIVPDFAEKTSAYLKVTWFPKDTNGLRN